MFYFRSGSIIVIVEIVLEVPTAASVGTPVTLPDTTEVKNAINTFLTNETEAVATLGFNATSLSVLEHIKSKSRI
jgi:hypothetical protein